MKLLLSKIFAFFLTLLLNKKSHRPKSLNRMLFVCSEGIGNAVMALPAIAYLRFMRSESKLYAWTASKPVAELLVLSGLFENIILASSGLLGYLSSIRKLRKLNFDWAALCFPTFTLNFQFVILFLKCNYCVSHLYRHLYFKSFEKFYDELIEIKENIHDVLQNANLLKSIDITIAKTQLFFPAINIGQYPDKKNFHWRQAEFPLVIFHPGSKAGHIYKQWPIDKFVQTALNLKKKKIAQPVFLIGPDENIFLNYIQMNHLTTLVSSSIHKTLTLLLQASLLVCNDSGVMHLGALVNIPMVVLWGATDQRRNEPWSQNAKILFLNLPCQPCVKFNAFTKCKLGGPPFPCLDISVEKVTTSCLNIIHQSRNKLKRIE